MKSRWIASLSVSLISLPLLLVSTNAVAAAFQLRTESAVDMGQANAGAAARAEDATTQFSNPAGLTRLKKQFVISNIVLTSRSEFNGTATATGRRLGPIQASNFSQTGETSSHGSGASPAIYFAAPILPRTTFGFGMLSPFAIGSEYGESSILRYENTFLSARVIDYSPGLGVKVYRGLSLGAAFDAMNFNIRQEKMARSENVTSTDSKLINDGSSWAYGWHAGALYEFTPQTRFGASYHSKIIEHAEGYSQLDIGKSNTPLLRQQVLQNNNMSLTVPIPPLASFSLYHDINPRWAILGSADWTQWSIFRSVQIQNVQSTPGTTSETYVYKFQDAWRYSLGSTFKVNPKFKLRSGIAFDMSPTDPKYSNMNVADTNSVILAVGAHYQIKPRLGWDFSYSHTFFNTANANHSQSTTPAPGVTSVTTTNGTVERYYNFFGMQGTFDIA